MIVLFSKRDFRLLSFYMSSLVTISDGISMWDTGGTSIVIWENRECRSDSSFQGE